MVLGGSKQWFSVPVNLLLALSGASTFASTQTLPPQAAYAVFEAETMTMKRVFDGTWTYCISIEGEDPSAYLFSRLQLLYEHIVPKSQCTGDANGAIDIKHIETINEDLIKVAFDCYAFCKYETTYTLQLASGNWLIQRARHRMQ